MLGDGLVDSSSKPNGQVEEAIKEEGEVEFRNNRLHVGKLSRGIVRS